MKITLEKCDDGEEIVITLEKEDEYCICRTIEGQVHVVKFNFETFDRAYCDYLDDRLRLKYGKDCI